MLCWSWSIHAFQGRSSVASGPRFAFLLSCWSVSSYQAHPFPFYFSELPCPSLVVVLTASLVSATTLYWRRFGSWSGFSSILVSRPFWISFLTHHQLDGASSSWHLWSAILSTLSCLRHCSYSRVNISDSPCWFLRGHLLTIDDCQMAQLYSRPRSTSLLSWVVILSYNPSSLFSQFKSVHAVLALLRMDLPQRSSLQREMTSTSAFFLFQFTRACPLEVWLSPWVWLRALSSLTMLHLCLNSLKWPWVCTYWSRAKLMCSFLPSYHQSHCWQRQSLYCRCAISSVALSHLNQEWTVSL